MTIAVLFFGCGFVVSAIAEDARMRYGVRCKLVVAWRWRFHGLWENR